MSFRIANKIYEEVSGLKEVYVWLLSQIGQPIDKPMVISVQFIPKRGDAKAFRREINKIVESEFDNLYSFCMDLAYGKILVC